MQPDEVTTRRELDELMQDPSTFTTKLLNLPDILLEAKTELRTTSYLKNTEKTRNAIGTSLLETDVKIAEVINLFNELEKELEEKNKLSTRGIFTNAIAKVQALKHSTIIMFCFTLTASQLLTMHQKQMDKMMEKIREKGEKIALKEDWEQDILGMQEQIIEMSRVSGINPKDIMGKAFDRFSKKGGYDG